jgi:uncharacterized protein (TIGR03435 family)
MFEQFKGCVVAHRDLGKKMPSRSRWPVIHQRLVNRAKVRCMRSGFSPLLIKLPMSITKHAKLTLPFLFACFALAAIFGPAAGRPMQDASSTGQVLRASDPLPSFEVASIKPSHSADSATMIGSAGIGAPKDRFIAKNISIKKLICWAYGGNSLPLSSDEVSGGPVWINSDRYDIEAKLEDSQLAELAKLPPLEITLRIRLMVQSLLVRRFGLVVKDTTVIRPVYVLALARSGSKLKETVPGDTSPIKVQGAKVDWMAERGEVRAHSVPITFLVRWLSQIELGRPF